MTSSAPQPDDATFNVSEEAKEIIKNLRAEVESQKQCITRYTVEAIAFVGAVWGLVLRFGGVSIPFYFCNTVLIFLLLVIVRIASHKYATINRNLGYELHISRLKDYAKFGKPEWAKKMMSLDWEEAMCAWRFVQPALFDCIYGSSDAGFYESLRPYIRKADQCRDDLYYWYETEALIAKGAAYHQGKYLHNVHRFLNVVACFSIIVMWCFLTYQLVLFAYAILWQHQSSFIIILTQSMQFLGIGFASLMITYYARTQIRRQTGYREILEGGILSIQSCAVVWRIVATCHILGSTWPLSKPDKDGKPEGTYKFYTTYTSAMSVDFIKNSFNKPHEWLNEWEKCYNTDQMLPLLEEKLGKVMPPPFNRKNLKPGKTVSITNVFVKIRRALESED